MTTENPRYIVNTVYGFTNESDPRVKDDFIFITYKDGLDKKTKMKIERDTSVKFFVTKPGLRNQNVKRQTCPVSELDGYTCQQKDLTRELAKALKIPGNFHKLADLAKSLYVYGADISSEFHLRRKWRLDAEKIAEAKDMPKTVPYSIIRRGGLDIETSVLGVRKLHDTWLTGNEINLITVVDEDFNVWTSVYKPFLQGTSEEGLKEHVYKMLGGELTGDDNKIEKYGLKINLYVSNDEADCIKWIMDRLNEAGLDYVSVWNMGFDIPRIIARLEFLGKDPKDYFCHPKVPDKYKIAKYVRGKTRPSEHFAERWDWFHSASTHVFYDSMAAFAKLRKVDGHENSYRLGYITDKYVKENKLFATQEATHFIMQTQRFLDYVAYNIWDAVLLLVLEKKMNHVHNLIGLSGDNPLSIFAKGTVQAKNNYYDYCEQFGDILVTVVGDSTTEHDAHTPALGGAVLNPNLALETGVDFLLDSSRLTRVHVKNKDSDATAMYPSITRTINDSRDTIIMTIMEIDGDKSKVEDFCTNYVDTKENAVYLCHKYFNLPSFEEMGRLFDESRQVA